MTEHKTSSWDPDDLKIRRAVLNTCSRLGVASDHIKSYFAMSDYEETALLISNLEKIGLLDKNILEKAIAQSFYIKTANTIYHDLKQANCLDANTFTHFAQSIDSSESIFHELRWSDLLNQENLTSIYSSGRDLDTIADDIRTVKERGNGLCQQDLDEIVNNANTISMRI